MNFHIITLFPESFNSYINCSIIGRAIKNKKIKILFYNPRNYVLPKKNKKKPFIRIDDKPYGGGPGMVISAIPIIKTIKDITRKIKNNSRLNIIWLSPSGKQFDNQNAEKFSKKYSDIIIICGRYEGIDERVRKVFKTQSISVGPYILTGGELPAMILIDSITRRIPEVLGTIESIEEKRVASKEVYTRPEIIEYNNKKYKVPKILLSGHHQKIEEWKYKKTKKQKSS